MSSPIQAIKDNISIYKGELQDIKEELRGVIQVYFKKFSDSFFVAHPEIASITWSQYTDYYNDQDTLPFKAYLRHPTIHRTDGKPPTNKDVDLGGEFLTALEEPTYELLFGGNVTITLTADEIKTEESEGY